LAEPGNIDTIKHCTSCNEFSARFIGKIKRKKVPSFIITVKVASSSPFFYLTNPVQNIINNKNAKRHTH
jgi:hypothetical protein